MTRLAIVAVFVLGAVAGATLGMRLERDRFLKMQRNGPATLTGQALKHISSEVKLQPEQYERLRGVLNGVQPALAAAENERRGKIIAVMESVRTSASAFLDAAQQKRYDQLHQRMKNRFTPEASGEPATAVAAFRVW